MARTSVHRMKPRKPPILDDYVQKSIEGGMNDRGHYAELVYSGVEEEERAREIRRALFRSAAHLKVSMKADLERAADDTWSIRFRAIDKATARAYIAQKAGGDPSKLDYNPYARH